MNCYYTLLLTFSSMSLLQVAIKPHINWLTAILHPENLSLEQGSPSQTIPGTSHHPQRVLSQWTPVRIFGLTIPKNPHKSRAVAPVDTNGDPFYDNPWKLCQGSQRIDVLAAIPLKFNSIKNLSSKNVLKSQNCPDLVCIWLVFARHQHDPPHPEDPKLIPTLTGIWLSPS